MCLGFFLLHNLNGNHSKKIIRVSLKEYVITGGQMIKSVASPSLKAVECSAAGGGIWKLPL